MYFKVDPVCLYDVLMKGSQEPPRLPYGAYMGPCGTCACTVRTRACTERVWKHPYDHSHMARASPGDGRECTYGSLGGGGGGGGGGRGGGGYIGLTSQVQRYAP